MAPTFSPNPQNFTKKDKTKAERRKPEEGDDDHHHNASQLFLNPWQTRAARCRSLANGMLMTLHQLRGLLLSSTKLETRRKEVENLTHQGKMNLDIIKMGKFLRNPPKNGFAVYAQNKWRGVCLGRSFIYI
jgi:hypothetical protein|uniref:Uncharacterized protein At2g04410 n=2 Tax=Arabidopsis thaliana TaxID=3702 RepID=Q9SJC8_ARATH|nr:unknown protein [Arabidopsis thaliana]